MKFSNKSKIIVYLITVFFASYIGYVLGNAFCVSDCLTDILLNILISNTVALGGVFVLVNLSEKSITEWNQMSNEEE
ncbi:MAG: hypothetical protein ACJ0GN_02800 [Candidatus Actinomarina sp.]|nr:MAG: hypothetical protein CND04_01070 [Candidatus Actinomarinales bacterium MED-G02]|tara:strand:- start:16135 stop:16365 length:231 start_codon:yes stop_codon:yes gene_type:complete